jgi:hypothetical protein
MTTLAQMIANARQPLVVRWELVTDTNGRTRPEMRWVATTQTSTRATDHAVTLAA